MGKVGKHGRGNFWDLDARPYLSTDDVIFLYDVIIVEAMDKILTKIEPYKPKLVRGYSRNPRGGARAGWQIATHNHPCPSSMIETSEK